MLSKSLDMLKNLAVGIYQCTEIYTRQRIAGKSATKAYKFHRQNPLELETPNLERSLAKHPSDLGLD